MDTSEQQSRRRELAATDDHRPARTKQRIVDALDELLGTGGSVSVTAVCARAGVGRSTFYTHFATVTDVVIHVVDEVFDELGTRDVHRRTTKTGGRRTITEIGIRELLQAFGARRQFFVYALSAPATERVRERLHDDVAAGVRESIRVERPDLAPHFMHTASDFIAGGTVGILVGWMADPGRRDEEAIVSALLELLPRWLTADDVIATSPPG